MKRMFYNATSFNQDISGWDVGSVNSSSYTDFATNSGLDDDNLPNF
jgi:surface protein